MLQSGLNSSKALVTHGFVVAVEVEEGVDLDHLINKLSDSLRWVEGVGQVEIEHLGELDVIEGINVTIREGALPETVEDMPLLVKES